MYHITVVLLIIYQIHNVLYLYVWQYTVIFACYYTVLRYMMQVITEKLHNMNVVIKHNLFMHDYDYKIHDNCVIKSFKYDYNAL